MNLKNSQWVVNFRQFYDLAELLNKFPLFKNVGQSGPGIVL